MTRGIRRPTGVKWSLPVLHVLFVWLLTLFDLHFLLAATIARPAIYLVYLGYPPLLLFLMLRGPAIMATVKSWVWQPPLLILVLTAVVTFPFAANKSFARESLQYMMIYYALALATMVYVKTPKQALPIVLMLVGQFAWYGMWARTQGLVPWHPTLSNYDGFGAYMVSGVALGYWYAVASRNPRWKLALYALAVYCVLGVVASYARAAFLSLVVVVGWTWMRSPRKLATAAYIGVAVIVVVVGASLMFEPGFFYKEIMSSFEEGASEGTGGHRWELWKVGFKVWMQRPIFGVGGGNFGAFASGHFRFGELEEFPNPGYLYGFNLHNSYMQVLSEFGLAGVLAFVWAIWSFQRRNREIRDRAAVQRWNDETGGQWDIRSISFGLEAANLANLMTGMFYASLFMPAYYTIWIVNLMLWAVTRPRAEVGSGPRRERWPRMRRSSA